jgi:hypothetical protein
MLFSERCNVDLHKVVQGIVEAFELIDNALDCATLCFPPFAELVG